MPIKVIFKKIFCYVLLMKCEILRANCVQLSDFHINNLNFDITFLAIIVNLLNKINIIFIITTERKILHPTIKNKRYFWKK